MHAESARARVMVRHATPAKRKGIWHAREILDIARPLAVGIGPDSGESMILWLATEHRRYGTPWLLCARFTGESWIHCIPSRAGLISVERIAREKNLQVLAAWFDPNTNRTEARFYKQGQCVAEFSGAGERDTALEVVSFKSSAHPKTLLKRCETTGQAVEAIFGALDARMRDLDAVEANGLLQLRGPHGQVVPAGEIDQLAIDYYVPLTAEENPAGVRLQSAIQSGDVEAADQAIADGASLEFLPDLRLSPLALACDRPWPGDWRGVTELLVRAGAPIDGYAWEEPPICSAIGPMKGSEETISECLQVILSLGAALNSRARVVDRGSTPLHLAVLNHYPRVIQFLLSQGASPGARDARGFTPLEFAEWLAKDDPDLGATGGAVKEDVSKLNLLEMAVRQLSGSPSENVRQRAQVVKLLREVSELSPEK